MIQCDIGIRVAFNKSVVDTDVLKDNFVVFCEDYFDGENLDKTEFIVQDCWFTIEMTTLKFSYQMITMLSKYIQRFIEGITNEPSSKYYGVQLAIMKYCGEWSEFTNEIFGDLGTNHEIKPRTGLQF